MSPLVDIARLYVGSPYVWAGKGTLIFDTAKLELVPQPWAPEVPNVLDCSGLVTVALHDAGGPDWRGSHSAQSLFNVSLPVLLADESPGDLVFFGPGLTHIDHVAVLVATPDHHRIVIEAIGGDRRTTSPEIAAQHGACVKEHPHARLDVVGVRRLPAFVTINLRSPA